MKSTIFNRITATLLAVAAMAFAAAPSWAQQSTPPQTTLESVVWFGGKPVDVDKARIVDISNGNNQITDALGVVRTGYFMNSNTFANTPAFKKYIRAYAGSNLFYNASMFNADCGTNGTRLNWMNGGYTDLFDSCSLHTQILQYARTN